MIWYDMIWYDMIWYDMIWYDMIWYDMIWYDMIWYDMIWYDMIWYDMIWYDMIWYDMIWYDMIWYDMIWYDMIWYDMIWYDMIWYDMIWYDMIWYDMIWYDMIWCMWERMHAPHTTLHQGQFFCDVLLCSVKFHPPFITILFVRNCFPTSFDDMMYVRTHACATSPLCALLDSQTPHMKQNACVCEPKTHAWANLQNACVSEPVTNTNTSHLQNIYQHVMWSHVF